LGIKIDHNLWAVRESTWCPRGWKAPFPEHPDATFWN
jgi:hypothetical protein